MYYFAYGSNMMTARLRQRVPSAEFVSRAVLTGHKLLFHKYSIDGSGKCNIWKTEEASDRVYGVVFEISDDEKKPLNRYEGLGNGYENIDVLVVQDNNFEIQARTYYATEIRSGLKPFHWYKLHVLEGAKEHNLPDYYISYIAGFESQPDPDRVRSDREMKIHPGDSPETRDSPRT